MAVSLVGMPSLDLIKGFVAVGRRMSITQAADDLCVTQSAMSKQIRTLEDTLGIRLLDRGHRSLSFTEEGQRLFQSANASVQQLQDALAGLSTQGKQPVTITASTGVAGLWLLPRFGDFQRLHPEVDLKLAASNAVMDLSTQRIDLAIRYCAENQAPRGAVKLFDEAIAPVASPALGLTSLDTMSVLASQVLLEFDVSRRPWLQWNDWLAARGWSPAQAKGILRFNQYEQLIQAAVAGQGVALGRIELLGPMLADGRLRVLRADDQPRPTGYGYWLIQADPNPGPEVARVVEWIVAVARPSPHGNDMP